MSSFELTAPEAYKVHKLNSFDGVGGLERIQFVSNAIGFITVDKDSIATARSKTKALLVKNGPDKYHLYELRAEGAKKNRSPSVDEQRLFNVRMR